MILPTIHLNGTSPESLFEGYRAAIFAISDAEDKLRAVEFNARDYYPQGGAAWDQAVREHRDRFISLSLVKEGLTKIAEHCQEAINERRDRAGEAATV